MLIADVDKKFKSISLLFIIIIIIIIYYYFYQMKSINEIDLNLQFNEIIRFKNLHIE
jgi:hypothetical protein